MDLIGRLAIWAICLPVVLALIGFAFLFPPLGVPLLLIVVVGAWYYKRDENRVKEQALKYHRERDAVLDRIERNTRKSDAP